MPAPIDTNRYRFPPGYRAGVTFQAPTYIPWNGYVNGFNSPMASLLGATLQLVSTAAPADLSTLQFAGADGNLYVFQFVYNASVQTTGIKIPLPLSGASTAAQVMTQIQSILSQAGGTPLAGAPVVFPWKFQPINATTGRINATQSGIMPGFSVTPAGVTGSIISVNTTTGLTLGTAPARVAFRGAFLPGV